MTCPRWLYQGVGECQDPPVDRRGRVGRLDRHGFRGRRVGAEGTGGGDVARATPARNDSSWERAIVRLVYALCD